MTAVKIHTFIIDNITTDDTAIAAAFPYTTTVFSVSVIPISNTQSRVILFYN